MTGWHWLFGGEVYYPSGGMNDLIGMYPTLDAAKTDLLKILPKLPEWG
jgi:hypothetical protein